MRVILSAYACEPNRGSEPMVGWNWAVQAARFHDVWVLTRANNQEAIECELARHPVPRLRFIYHDLPAWARWWKRGNRGVNLYAYLWQLTAIPRLREAHARHRFDLGQHVTLVSLRHPSALAWADIPFIWGPVAGCERAPLAFYPAYGLRGAFEQMFRGLSIAMARVDPLVRHTQRTATLVLAATPEAARRVSPARVVPAIGIDPDAVPPRDADDADGPLRLLYVGNLVYWKGLQLGLAAMATAIRQGVDCTLTVAGDGRYRTRLQDIADRLGLASRVTFLGRLPHGEVLDLYRRHDALLFPSMRDSGGFVALEAGAARLPVICLRLGGLALSVTEATGVALPATTPRNVEAGIADAIDRLAGDRALIRGMGDAARERMAEVYAWERAGERIDALYAEVSDGKTDTAVETTGSAIPAELARTR